MSFMRRGNVSFNVSDGDLIIGGENLGKTLRHDEEIIFNAFSGVPKNTKYIIVKPTEYSQSGTKIHCS